LNAWCDHRARLAPGQARFIRARFVRHRRARFLDAGAANPQRSLNIRLVLKSDLPTSSLFSRHHADKICSISCYFFLTTRNRWLSEKFFPTIVSVEDEIENPMNQSDIRPLLAAAALALLTACGGTAAPDDGQTTTAALMVQGNAPVADCEAEGCNRPRIIDGNAEQYRAGAAVQAPQAEPLQADLPQPTESQQNGIAGRTPDTAAPAVGGQPQ
jgi:hypothetical protein